MVFLILFITIVYIILIGSFIIGFDRVEEFKSMSKPLVLCCLSGGRSGQATQYLAQQGVEDVYNGGGWSQVQMHKM